MNGSYDPHVPSIPAAPLGIPECDWLTCLADMSSPSGVQKKLIVRAACQEE